MKKIFVGFRKNSFFKNVLILAGGTASSQAITLLCTPFITRLFGPAAYGAQGVFMTLVGVLAAITTFSLPLAITLPLDETEAYRLSKLSFFASLMTSMSLMMFIFIFNEFFIELFKEKGGKPLLYLLPVALFVAGLYSIASQNLIREKKFSHFSKINVISATTLAALKMAAGLIAPSAFSLTAVNITGAAFSATLLRRGMASGRNISSYLKINSPEIAALLGTLRTYKQFIYFRTPQGVLNSLALGMPAIFLAAHFGVETAGFFSLATAVIAMPSALIGGSAMQVFLPRFKEAKAHGEDMRRLLQKATVFMAISGAVPFFAIAGFGPDIFAIVFGAEWFKGGQYAQWLGIAAFFSFIARPSLIALTVIGKERANLIFETCGVIAKISVMYASEFYFRSSLYVVAAFAVVSSVVSILVPLLVIQMTIRKANRSSNG